MKTFKILLDFYYCSRKYSLCVCVCVCVCVTNTTKNYKKGLNDKVSYAC